jgi:DnaJ family protein C protein 7
MVQKADLLVQLRKYSEAEQCLSQLEKLRPGNPEIALIRGLIHYNKDSLKSAKESFVSVLKKVPDHARAADVYRKVKKLQETKVRADDYVKEKEYVKALETYTEALSVDTKNHFTNAKLFCNRALVHLELGKIDDAISDCTEAIQFDQNYTKAYVRRARCFRKRGRLEEAMNDLELASELEKSPEIAKLLEQVTKDFEAAERKKKKDYHQILGVSKTASQSDIKKAYMILARKHHPDKHSAGTPVKRLQEERKFKGISEAYTALSGKI